MKNTFAAAILITAIVVLGLPLRIFGQINFDADAIKGPSCIIVDSVSRQSVLLSPAQSQYNVVVTDGYAHIRLVQKFINPFPTQASAAYVFPLPHEGSVHAMAMEYHDKIYSAKIFEKAQAQHMYDSVKALGQNAALLIQERPNIFQQSLANIAPGDSAYVKIEISMPLKYNAGEYELAIPTMIGERFQSAGSATTVPSSGKLWNPPEDRSGQRLQINVLIQTGFTIENLSSPTHPIGISALSELRSQLIERGVMSDTARLELAHNQAVLLEPSLTYPNRDYVLRFRRPAGKSDFTFASHFGMAYKKGHFALNLFPDDSLFGNNRPALEIVLLIDISGSQGGWPLQKEKEIALDILSRLNENDRISLLAFSDRVTWAFGKQTPVWATTDSIRIAQNFIAKLSVMGGTQLLSGVQAALSAPLTTEHQRYYIFLTDGFITNESAILENISNHPTKPTIFTFGAGNSLNRYFLERCADVGNGYATEVTQYNDVIPLIDKAWDKIESPQLQNVTVSFGRMAVADLIMPRGTALYKGSPLTLYGTYTGTGNTEPVVVKGYRSGVPIEFTKTITFASGWNMNYMLPQIWAKQKIEKLALDEGTTSIRKDSIIAVSVEYQVLSKYTAFLAINPQTVSSQESLDNQMKGAFTLAADATSVRIADYKVIFNDRGLIIIAPFGQMIAAFEVLDLSGRLIHRFTSGTSLSSKLSWDGRIGSHRLQKGQYILRIRFSNGRLVAKPITWSSVRGLQ